MTTRAESGESAPARPTSLTGRVLGEFELGERLGSGGFGDVYRANQRALGRDAVVKILRAHHLASEVAIQRFLREGQLASQLDHPYAAHIYACGAEPDGVLWIAMELVRGTPLDKLLQASGPIPLDRCLGLLERLCEVIAQAHEQGIVHRDIKPANVMVLSRSGKLLPKLLDLGIAARLDDPTRPRAQTNPTRAPSNPIDGLAETAKHVARITENSVVVGTPLYMAPETWAGSSMIDHRSDLYALGVLAFQCMTGQLPFHASDISGLAKAHCEADVPPLGLDFPKALDSVLRRALAKRPEDRYATALEMASALRDAVVPSSVERVLPTLSDATATRVRSSAPQPIAAPIGAIQRARSLGQLRLAIARSVRSIVRYLGALALASRSRMDRETAPLDDARSLLHELRRRRLDDRERLRLIGMLCDVDELRDAFALPELVDFALGAIPGRNTLATLVQAIAETSTDDEHGSIAAQVADLGKLLDELQFLDAYRLIVGTQAGAEAWMGHAPADQIGSSLARPPERGRALLIAGECDPVLDFGPLVQIASPLPGTPEDVFVFDGPVKQRASLVSANGFELVDEHVWDWIGEHLLANEATIAATAHEQSPYRGLATFTQADAGLFFGRERELASFRNRMRVQPLLAVVGSSGAGKSSFVHAGVLPTGEFQAITMRPGHAPLAALAAVLAGRPAPELETELARDPNAAGRRLRASSQPKVLVVDQLEELFTLCSDSTARVAFAAALVGAARTIEEPVRVIVTLRDDFLVRTQELVEIRGHIAQGMFLLATPASEDLLRILNEPCAHAGYQFEDPELPARMVADVAGRPAALALLSFAAARLWELRDRHFRLLRVSAYRSMGGVSGALAGHADSVFDKLSHDEQRTAREAFRQLVTADNTRAVLARADLIKLAGGEQTIEKLVSARLLAVSESPDGGERIELVHEALITSWPRLDMWRRSDEAAARLRDQLRDAAKQWDARSRPAGLLWRDDALAELERWRAIYTGVLTDTEESFVAASRSTATRIRRIRRTAIVVAFVGLFSALAIVTWQQTQTARERDLVKQAAARERIEQARAYFESGRRAGLVGDERTAIADISKALELGYETLAARIVIAKAMSTLRARVTILREHTGQVSALVMSPDGRILASGGGDATVRLWNLASGKHLRAFKLPAYVWRIQFAPDGKRIVACGYDGFVAILDVETGHTKHVRRGGDQVLHCEFVAAGARIATGTTMGQVQIWDVASGALAHELPGHAPVWRDLFVGELEDGTLVTTSDKESLIRVWDSRGRPLATLETKEPVEAAVVGPNGTLVTAGLQRHGLQFWSIPNRKLLDEISAHTARVIALQVSRDGTQLLSASSDGAARVWRLPAREHVATLTGASQANAARFSVDGNNVVIASSDGARVFATRSGQLRARLDGHENNVSVAEIVGGRVATASWDRTIQLWELGRGTLVAEHGWGVVESVQQIAVSRDGKRLAAGGNGAALIIDAHTGQVERRLVVTPDQLPSSIVFTPNNEIVAIVDTGVLATFALDGRRLGERGRSQPSGAHRLDMSPDGRSITIATAQKTTEVWRFPEMTLTKSLASETRDYTCRTSMIARGAAGDIAVAKPSEVELWTESGERRASVSTQASALALGAGLLATGADDGEIRVWNSRTGQPVATLKEHQGHIFNLTWLGEELVSASADSTIRRWKPLVSNVSRVMRGHTAAVLSADVSSDGRLFATGGLDDTIRIWDLEAETEIVRIQAHGDGVFDVRWVGSDRIASTGGDGAIRVWALNVDHRPVEQIREEARCLLVPKNCSPTGGPP